MDSTDELKISVEPPVGLGFRPTEVRNSSLLVRQQTLKIFGYFDVLSSVDGITQVGSAFWKESRECHGDISLCGEFIDWPFAHGRPWYRTRSIRIIRRGVGRRANHFLQTALNLFIFCCLRSNSNGTPVWVSIMGFSACSNISV